jgi:hypothetical protein
LRGVASVSQGPALDLVLSGGEVVNQL